MLKMMLSLLAILALTTAAATSAHAFSLQNSPADQSGSTSVADPDANLDDAENCYSGDTSACKNSLGYTSGHLSVGVSPLNSFANPNTPGLYRH